VRVDQNTLEVRAAEGFLVEPFNQIYRPRSRPMRAGDKVFVRSAEVEITETFPSGEPRAARFRFIWPLDSRQLVFADLTGCSWRDGYRSVPPP
jgi:hypothetical protein